MSLYLDHAATTPLSSSVLKEMMPYLTDNFGNASSLYRQGQIAKESLDDARFSISQIIDCNLDEIIFTSGATESNNIALRGIIANAHKKNQKKKCKKNEKYIPHVISTNIEHASVKNVLKTLADEKIIEWTALPVEKNGILDIEKFKESIQENTLLVSIIAVNNEMGAIQPLSRIGRICQKKNIIFHVDAVQSVGQIKVSAEYWKCDLLSLSGHKFYGPKGVGLLYIKSGTEIDELSIGGGQERGYRSGTENVAGIIGMKYAFEESQEEWEIEKMRLNNLQKFAKEYIEKNISFALWNGPEIGDERSTANINFSLPKIDGESLLMRLDLDGISVSLGSACSAGMMEASHVLLALGRDENEAKNALRITFGKNITEENLKPALKKIVDCIHQLEK